MGTICLDQHWGLEAAEKCDIGNVFKDRIKGSEDPGSRSFFRILIGIWTAPRIGRKDLDPFQGYSNQIPIPYFTPRYSPSLIKLTQVGMSWLLCRRQWTPSFAYQCERIMGHPIASIWYGRANWELSYCSTHFGFTTTCGRGTVKIWIIIMVGMPRSDKGSKLRIGSGI